MRSGQESENRRLRELPAAALVVTTSGRYSNPFQASIRTAPAGTSTLNVPLV